MCENRFCLLCLKSATYESNGELHSYCVRFDILKVTSMKISSGLSHSLVEIYRLYRDAYCIRAAYSSLCHVMKNKDKQEIS